MVEHLEIFGKKYPVRIGYYVMKKVKEEHDKSFTEALADMKETKDLEVHETILYAALEMGAYAEKQEMDLKREEMPMILDMVFADYLKLFTSDSFFPEDLKKKIKDQQNAEGNPEKKPKRTKSST